MLYVRKIGGTSGHVIARFKGIGKTIIFAKANKGIFFKIKTILKVSR
jgi:hypothetical protein